MYTAEQFQAARRTQTEALFGLTAKAYDGIERLVRLNLRTTKAAIDDAGQTAAAVLSARSLQSLIEAQTGAARPAAVKISAYGRELFEILSTTSSEVEGVGRVPAAEFRASVTEAAARMTEAAESVPQQPVVTLQSAAEATADVAEVLERAAAEGAAAVEAAADRVVIVSADATVKNVVSGRKSKRNAE